MHERSRGVLLTLALVAIATGFWGCAKKSDGASSCAPAPTERIADSSGTAMVFLPDPRMASGNHHLRPTADLDRYRSRVQLSHLTGKGILQGQYVDAVSASSECGEQYGALSTNNDFEYSEKDPRFQEAMSYYFGDSYQSALVRAGVSVPTQPIEIVAHCMKQDNSFYQVSRRSDGQLEEEVCLGDSRATPGASYADDAYVIVHELQHGMTMRHYSLTNWLGEFDYDEGGAVNEGISDFMAMMYLSPLVPKGFHKREFSTWALGSFVPHQKAFRGATRCPVYDPTWPRCTAFPHFKGAAGEISYVYPDGLGWPFADNYSRSTENALSAAFMSFPLQEEIHNNAIVIEGTLWDVYQGILADHPDERQARALMMRLIAKTVEDLPKPDSQDLSPVNFRVFGSSLLYIARAMNLETTDIAAITQALHDRGLIGGNELGPLWAAQGPGMMQTPGLRIEDDTPFLRNWLKAHGIGDSFLRKRKVDGRLEPGETAVVWFDLQDVSPDGLTAGGVTLTVSSLDPGIKFLQEPNPGWMSDSKVQVQYAKVNGWHIVSKVAQRTSGDGVFTGTSYFLTDPEYAFGAEAGLNLNTGIWVQVSSSVPRGKTIRFEVNAAPSNGASSTVQFDAKIE